MAVAINRSTEWGAGAGTPVKYSVEVNGTIDLKNQRTTDGRHYADLVVNLNISVSNHPNNSQNSFAASDFAIIGLGNLNPKNNYPFGPGVYYESGLPAPESIPTNLVVAEFRGDTLRPNPNRVSLWTASSGMVINSESSEGTWSHNVSVTRTIEFSTSGRDEPVLVWAISGTDPGQVSWLDQTVWSSLADFDYRPGNVRYGGHWKSTNRDGGKCHIRQGGQWVEMRTIDGGSGTNDPPKRRSGGVWKNQYLIGEES